MSAVRYYPLTCCYCGKPIGHDDNHTAYGTDEGFACKICFENPKKRPKRPPKEHQPISTAPPPYRKKPKTIVLD
jgi:hypothetical protein